MRENLKKYKSIRLGKHLVYCVTFSDLNPVKNILKLYKEATEEIIVLLPC